MNRMKYEMIVDGQSLRDLVFITSVNRKLGPVEKDRILKVKGYIIDDILATNDVLNRLLTGELQQFIFTDQPDRYWEGRVKGGIELSNYEKLGSFTFEIEVPDGVSYSTQLKEIEFTNAESVIIENNGTHEIYPTFNIKPTSKTHMVSLTSKEDIFQYGEPIEASPLDEVTFTNEQSETSQLVKRRKMLIQDQFDKNTWQSYDISQVNPNWRTTGSFGTNQVNSKKPVNGYVTIRKKASHWQTGERMANWVKGKRFKVDGVKNVNQSHSKKAYRLKNGNWYLGWLLEQDIEGSTGNEKSSLVPQYGSSPGHVWHGPAITQTFSGKPTDFDLSFWHFFEVSRANQMGAVYVGLFAGDREVAGVTFSSHRSDKTVYHYFEIDGKGVNKPNEHPTFSTNSYGRIHILKRGSNLRFEIRNDRKNQRWSKSYSIPKTKDLGCDRVVIWCGKYNNASPIADNRPEYFHFRGEDVEVYANTPTEKAGDAMNLPDPKYTWNDGDQLLVSMEDLEASVNGATELSPIAYGSKAISIPPGRHEVILTSNSKTQPNVEVTYREAYR